MKAYFLILVFFVSTSSVFSGELVLSGTYGGKDLYVRNPFNRNTNSFCTGEVYVNDRKVYDNPRVSAFKIDLSYLRVNDLVVVRITYADGCEPKVVNPQVLQTPETFQFLSTVVDNNAISWTTLGESNGRYIVEHADSARKWYEVDSIATKNSLSANLYAIPAPHTAGENKYRVRYKNAEMEVYSVEMFFTFTDNPITFSPLIVTTTLTLSDSTDYVITDFWGKSVKAGRGTEINVIDLKAGQYYLTIQNRKHKFVKK